MAAINVVEKLELIPGAAPVEVKVGTLGKGKGASKVRLVPVTKDPEVWIALLRTLPKYETIISKAVGSIFSNLPPPCITGVPAELSEENLKAGLNDGTITFDQQALNELISDEFNDERAGRVSAHTKLTEWNEANGDEYNQLVRELVTATSNGVSFDDAKTLRIQQLALEQAQLSEAVAEELERKKELAAKRAAKPKTTTA